LTTPTAWTPGEDAFVRHLVQEGKDSAEIAALCREAGIARTQKSIQRRRERQGWHAKVAESPVAPMAGPLTAKGDMVILADPHAPFHDSGWMNRVIDLALSWGIRLAGVPGDLIDWTAFCAYGRNAGVEAETEIAAAEQITRTLARNFQHVYYAPGNHEQRLGRVTGYALSLERLSEWWVRQPNVHTTARKWFLLESGGRTYRIVHPRNYSRNPPGNSVRLCAKYRQDVIAGHSHHWGMAMDVSGENVAIDCGMCAAPRLLEYVEVEASNNPAMCQGACIVQGGVPVLLSPQNIPFYERIGARLAA
jgi:hypothetical protein